MRSVKYTGNPVKDLRLYIVSQKCLCLSYYLHIPGIFRNSYATHTLALRKSAAIRQRIVHPREIISKSGNLL